MRPFAGSMTSTMQAPSRTAAFGMNSRQNSGTWPEPAALGQTCSRGRGSAPGLVLGKPLQRYPAARGSRDGSARQGRQWREQRQRLVDEPPSRSCGAAISRGRWRSQLSFHGPTPPARAPQIRLEAERRRIGLELHDSAKQRIHAAHLVLSSLQAERVNGDGSALHLAMQELQAAADEMDASVAELRTTLGGRGLDEVLNARAAELQEASGVAIRVHGKAGPLPTFVTVHAYRVAAEAMTNAVRHAAASRVDVMLDTDGERLRVTVTDDGRGLTREARDSTGIASMQARARTLGGRLELAAGPGATGTSVLLDVPVRPAVTVDR